MFEVKEVERKGAAPGEEDVDAEPTDLVREVVHKRFRAALDGEPGLTDIGECRMDHDHKT